MSLRRLVEQIPEDTGFEAEPFLLQASSPVYTAQLDAMHLRQLQAAATTPSPGHPRPRDEKDVRPHPKARRTSSTDESRRKSSVPENHFTPIRELSESFERRLHFRSRHAVSLGAADELCVICHDELSTGGVRELQCAHRFHKECIERWLWKKQTCPTCRVHVVMPAPFYWSSTRIKVP